MPASHRAPRRGSLSRGLGELLLTAGYLVLLMAVYEVWASDVISDQRQDEIAVDLRQEWRAPAPAAAGPADGGVQIPPLRGVEVGEAFAFLHVPRLGAHWSRAVVEGTDPDQLEQGPGHYEGTALPGQRGNFALAGHRVGRGSPFLEIDALGPGDPLVVETPDAWYVYRVLGDRASGDLTADPSGIPGQRIVAPTDLAVISPTPGGPARGPATGAYLTLTTCHPEYSARQRLVVHAVLDGPGIPKSESADGPAALRER